MKTICYVDGYNLYYGCLRNTPHKWLDLPKLLKHILHQQNPNIEVLAIKFFTAPVIARFASNPTLAQKSQDNYHNALTLTYPNLVEVIKGYYNAERSNGLRYLKPPNKKERVEVWKLEEKQTDVNIALTAYRDAARGIVEQLVFVTNDTDQEPTLKALHEDFGETIKIGVILPIKETGNEASRPPNARLSKYASWTRKYIKNDELKMCHFPDTIPTNRKPIKKPLYW